MATPSLLQALWAQAWQLAAMVMVVGLIARFGARNRPHLAHALWLVVLLKCVTPPVWDSPVGVFSWCPVIQWDGGDENGVRTIAAADEPAYMVTIAEIVPSLRSHVAAEPAASGDASGGESARAPLTDGLSLADRLGRAAVTIWLVGVGAIGLLAAVRVAICWRRLHESAPQSHPELEKLLRTLARRLRIRRGVRLLIHGSRVGPAVMGLWRPTVLLPSCVVQGRSAAQLEPILAHEMIHIRRGDLWVGLLQTVAEAIWWFHPLVWLAGRMISREAERSCDEEVLGELGCDPSSYARSLLVVLELKRTLIPAPAVPGVRVVDITSQRLERIMTLGQGCRRRTPWWCWVVTLATAALALPGSPVRIRATERAAPRDSNCASAPVRAVGDSASAVPTKFAQQTGVRFPPQREGDLIQFEVGPSGETTAVYHVSDVLKRIEDQAGVDRAAARRLLWTRLRAAQRDTAQLGPAVSGSSENAVKPAEGDDPPAYWLRDTLVIQQSIERHHQTSGLFDEVRKLGIDMLEIEIRFLTSPLKVMTDVSRNWTTLPMLAGSAPGELPLGPPPGDAAAAGVATVSVEKNLPVILDVLNEGRTKRLIDVAQGDRRANLLQAPRLRLFNGQAATVSDCTQTPFVVGFKENKPQIRVVEEGINVRVRPLFEGDHARLQFEILFSGIRDVDEVDIRGPDGARATIQVPEVALARVASTIDAPLGQTVLVGGLKELGLSKNTKNAQSLGVLLSVKKVSAKDAQAAAAGMSSADAVKSAQPQDTIAGREVAGGAKLACKVARDAPAKEAQMYFITYGVADLVFPIPNPIVVPLDAEAAKRPAPLAKAEFNPLVDLIIATVRPHSWETVGGTGTIQPFPQNLSLVIFQTRDGHDEIAKLLEQLRKNRSAKACVEMRTVNDAPKLCEVLSIDPEKLAAERFLAISPEQTQQLTEADNLVVTARRVELFSGQSAEFRTGLATSLFGNGMIIQSTLSNDRRSVRLQVQGLRTDKQPPPVITMTLRDDDSMLFDVSPARAPAAGRKYVLLTPRIVARDEEEGKVAPAK